MDVRPQIAIQYLKSAIGWLVVGLPVLALLLRFGMRALGVRTDVPFPGFLYSVTAPVVEPFYSIFPASPRFDTGVIELASLTAAGLVFAGAVIVYLLMLLLASLFYGGPSEGTESEIS
jgi:hypothetical protein